MEKAVKLLAVILLLAVLIPAMACGGSKSAAPQGGFVSGNWQFTLSGTPSLTGFLNQSGGAVNGSLISAGSCPGSSPVSGTVNGQNVSLNIDQSASTISLTGTMNSGAPVGGNFTTQPSGGLCSPASGTWSAVQVAPIAGSFHGTFTSTASLTGHGTVTVEGTLNQGANTGNSTATLAGTLAVTSGPTFCSFILPGTITGLISGTFVQLNLFGEDGSEFLQLGSVGSSANPNFSVATITPDGTSISGTYMLGNPSSPDPCGYDAGQFQLTFP